MTNCKQPLELPKRPPAQVGHSWPTSKKPGMSPTYDTVADTQPAAETATELLPPSQRSAAGAGWGGGSANIPDTTAETTTDLPPPTGDGGGVFPHIANVKTATSAGRPFMADIKKSGMKKSRV